MDSNIRYDETTIGLDGKAPHRHVAPGCSYRYYPVSEVFDIKTTDGGPINYSLLLFAGDVYQFVKTGARLFRTYA